MIVVAANVSFMNAVVGAVVGEARWACCVH